MGCGSSKVSDVSQPVPINAEIVVKEHNDYKTGTKGEKGENERLERRDDINVYNDDTKHADDNKTLNGDNENNVNWVRNEGKSAIESSNKNESAYNIKNNVNELLDKDSENHHQKETARESTTESSKARSSISTKKDEQTDTKGTADGGKDRGQDRLVADRTVKEKSSNTASTTEQNKNKLTSTRSPLISKNKSNSGVNKTINNDEGQKHFKADDSKPSGKGDGTKKDVIADDNVENARAGDTKNVKTSGRSNGQTGTKSTNQKSSLIANKSGPNGNFKKTAANEGNQRGRKGPVIGQPKWRHDYDIPFVDPEEGLEELPDIYKSMDQPVKIEDTFWSGKRKVIPDFQVMRDIDKHALTAPQNIKKNLKLLVQYLVKPAKNNLEKYRAIARWIGENIEYDVDVYFTGRRNFPSDPQSTLNKGSAVCAGYSNLFQAMCKEVGLECEVITGKAKGLGYLPGSDKYDDHAWNKIVVDNKPFLCDVTWGSGSIGAEQKFKRLWKEHEFLSEPVSFTQSRLPIDLQNNSEVNESAQLCEKPFKSLKKWASLPHYGSMLQAAGATLAPKEGTITAKTNEGEIRMSTPRLLEVYTTLKTNSTNANLKGNHVMIFWEGNTAVLRFALPGPGKYQLSVIARFVSAADKETKGLSGRLVNFCINATGTQSHPPFQVEHGYYGNNPYIFLTGYQCLSHDHPVIETNSYRVLMQFACPEFGKAMFRLLNSSKRNSKEEQKVENCLYVDKMPHKYACYIFLPKPGNYLLQQLTITEPGKESYMVRATYIIKFKGKIPTITGPFPKHTDWGTRKLFHDSKFQLMNIDGSTIRLTEGQGLLSFCRPLSSKREILVNVVTMEDKIPPDSREWAIITKDKITSDVEQVNVTISLPKSGFYGLNLFIDRQFAGRFFISSDAKVSRNQEKG